MSTKLSKKAFELGTAFYKEKVEDSPILIERLIYAIDDHVFRDLKLNPENDEYWNKLNSLCEENLKFYKK